MKKIILLASLSAFLAAPGVACDMDHAKDDKASVSTDKTTVKADAKTTKTKAAKTVASTTTKKAKI
jgi:hypothetical protein